MEVDLHTSVSYCVVIRSCVAILHCVAFLLVSAALLQGAYSKIEKQMRGQRMRQKNSKREGWASSVKTFVMGRGVMYAGQVVKIESSLVFFFVSVAKWCLIRVRVWDGGGEAEVSEWALG